MNSKSGFNRIGLTRLTVGEEDKDTFQKRKEEKEEVEKRLERHEMAGLEIMSRSSGTKEKLQQKRKCPDIREGGRRRKRKKLKYEVIGGDWGLENGEMEKIEALEVARTRFLHSGPGECRITSRTTQSIIRVWSEAELASRRLAREIISAALDDLFLTEETTTSHPPQQPTSNPPELIRKEPLNKTKSLTVKNPKLKFNNRIPDIFQKKALFDLQDDPQFLDFQGT